MLANTASGTERLTDLRERIATAQEEFRTRSLAERRHARLRWTETTTLLPLVTSAVALLLSLYAVLLR
jgi:hypothetical protein